MSETVSSFGIENITTANCSITNFVGSGTEYSAQLVPSAADTVSVIVGTNEVTDLAGNSNDTSSNEISFTFSSDDVLASLSSSDVTDSGSSKNSSVEITLTLSEAPYNGVDEIISSIFDISNGSVSNISATASNNVFTFDFTSSSQLQESKIKLKADELVGQNVNTNLASNTFTWTYDATPPTMTITSSTIESGETSNDETITVTFTSSEDISGFDTSSISLTNASISGFSGTGSEYTATITPTVELTKLLFQ